ncbi:UDP-glucose dehydrogenase family protein [Desertihabitans aurantiacus]|uniref:UDP-glucose dehydrogenase family protein n=1 Tax=Desertihabitans aurantiacus TaxID=2282477 RepID=UPI000DF76348|nr:UDP-glucose/GDP-mannose dehydrogenase family protein [Desertihabitans aurantiacus]
MTVIGTGYLGATHAAAMAELGHEVLGVDNNPDQLAALREGRTPFFEPGLEELLAKHVASGRLRFTDSYAEAADFADLHFICVGTPQRSGSYAADMTYVDSAFSTIAEASQRPALLVGKSTVPVGTAARLQELITRVSPAGDGMQLAWNPEFLREGFAVKDTLHPDRIVLGTESPEAEQRLREVYARPISEGTPVVVTDFPTAELVKTAANAFLATKISFINAMAEVCEAAGGDVTVLADAIGHDARIGRRFLNAGVGFGGGCLPKDIRAFMARAGEIGVDQAVTFLTEIDSINLRRRTGAVEVAAELLGGQVSGRRVAVLGAAFKPDSDDVRDSPALDIAAGLHVHGADVRVYDPKAMHRAALAYPALGYADSLDAAVDGAEVVLLLTEWAEFRALTPADLDGKVAGRAIFDGRNVLDPAQWREAGWTYRGVGR